MARRILDRLVGYKLSPFLAKVIRRGLSAGRVQSVAVRLIVDREEEIRAFVPQEYWSIDGKFIPKGERKQFPASFYGLADGTKVDIHNEEEANRILQAVDGDDFIVDRVKKGQRRRSPAPPFTTSTLQQEASRKLGFQARRTMKVAQELYEGVELKDMGAVGLITYMRTDSLRISEDAIAEVRTYIGDQFGSKYLPEKERHYKTKANAQDGHEAIRPTSVALHPDDIKDSLTGDQYKLYSLIWKRFVASRMSAAQYDTTSVKIQAKDQIFALAASRMRFDGFMSVYTQEDDKEEENVLGGNLDENSVLEFQSFDPKQHFTQPPAHYTEASLVRAMEELGIGRPSTYAPTITTILARRYIAKENRNLYVTELGEVVNNMMKEAFPSIVDVNFTANMEALLDGVEEGTVKWKTIVSNFYPDLDEAVKKAEKDLAEVTIADEESDEVCELCGRRMVIKYGPHGRFLACPGFPECRNTKPYFEKIGVACPKCGKDIVMKKTKKGRKYYGCIDNPECDFMVWQKPSGEKCPRCGKLLLEKGNKLVCMDEQCGYVKNKPTEEK